ncbi:phosphatase PAP2 family protein [Natrialbaceae archaeon AArc-T1-2]|uniref:phosphatase PAP2 family protein n=1 Tax=Natrialbaceae archaeon AArc-T1-2 TaxID=3053904 RepID=UPI00255AEBF7|nr:phosphatase PAP2 family protein [Natrialbaceae archaeon AArc-T1-2]WIV68610.1 phosphatase PAP2 family protein [Natrialbaceae archaeon AArc-T1-2]
MAGPALENALFDESVNEAIRAGLPDPAIAFFELVTHLGDGATLVVVAVALYWFGPPSRRETWALVIAIGIAALAISAGLKGIVAHARPELAFAPAGYPGYSFPSAHALGSAAVYGALATLTRVGTRLKRYAIAGTIVLLVALSRIVIGVHYPGDVVAGVVLGLLVVALVARSTNPTPEPIFAFSGLLAVVAFALGSSEYTTMTIGAAVGATLSWGYVSRRSWYPHGGSLLVLGYLFVPLVVAIHAVTFLWQPRFVWGLYWIVEITGYALAASVTMLIPAVAGGRIDRLRSRLPAWARHDDSRESSDDHTGAKR